MLLYLQVFLDEVYHVLQLFVVRSADEYCEEVILAL